LGYFKYIVPLLGVGIFGWLSMLATVAMGMSSVTAVRNSILPGRYKPKLLLSMAELQKTSTKESMNEKEVVGDVISKTSIG
jgi:hypothetical protein